MIYHRILYIVSYTTQWASLVAQRLKHLPAMRETQFDPWVGKIPWRRKWQPTPVFLPGESHGQRSLVGYSSQGLKESDRTERLHFHYITQLGPFCLSILYIIFYFASVTPKLTIDPFPTPSPLWQPQVCFLCL